MSRWLAVALSVLLCGVVLPVSAEDVQRHTLIQEDLGIVHPFEVEGCEPVYTQTNLSCVVTSIGSAVRTILLPVGTWTISSNLTIPANISLYVPSGSTVSVSSGATLTINGSFRCDANEDCLSLGAGSYVFGPNSIGLRPTAANALEIIVGGQPRLTIQNAGRIDLASYLNAEPMTFAALSGLTPADGDMGVCSDCGLTSTSDNTCSGSGTGAFFVRLNGAWRCFSTQDEESGGGGGGAPTGAAGGVLGGTYPNPGFAVDMATEAELTSHSADTTAVHGITSTGALVVTTDPRLTDSRTPSGAAGGDLTGTYPNPTIAPNSMVLGTDTIGSYINKAQVAGGLTMTGTEAAELGLNDCATLEVLRRNAGDTDWECITAIYAGSTAGGDLTGTYPNPTILPNAIDLGIHTTGSYVGGSTANQGLLMTGTEDGTLGLIDCAASEILKRNAGDTAWECATDASGGGGGTPGGADTQVQYNDGGAFGGDSGLTFNETTNVLTAGGFVGDVTGNASTATALAANGANCSAGQFPLGVSTLGAAETCTALPTTIAGTANQIAASAATGPVTLSIPTNPTLPGTTTGTFVGPLTGNASTATALAANAANCSAGQAPLGSTAAGAAEGCYDIATQTELDAHLSDTTDAHAASAITFTPTGTVAATTVQAAIAEVSGDVTAASSASAPIGATYVTQTPHATLSGEQALSLLSSGLVLNTTTTGVLTIYGGAACTNQFIRSLTTSGVATCTGVAVADMAFDPATQVELDAHVNDTTAAHAASAISFTPTGTIAATTSQAAIAEVASEAVAKGYLTKTAEADLTNELALGSLASGLLLNTTTTGVPTIYAGASCTNQFPRSLNASGAATCASVATTDLNFDPATQTELTAHIDDTADAHAASAIGFTPDGSITATTVQAAIAEVRTEAAPTLSDVAPGAGDACPAGVGDRWFNTSVLPAVEYVALDCTVAAEVWQATGSDVAANLVTYDPDTKLINSPAEVPLSEILEFEPAPGACQHTRHSMHLLTSSGEVRTWQCPDGSGSNPIESMGRPAVRSVCVGEDCLHCGDNDPNCQLDIVAGPGLSCALTGTAPVMVVTCQSGSSTVQMCGAFDAVGAGLDNKILGAPDFAWTVEEVWCNYEGAAPTTAAQFQLEDGSNAVMTHTPPTCASAASAATKQSVTNNSISQLVARQALRFDTTNTPNPTTDNYLICAKGVTN